MCQRSRSGLSLVVTEEDNTECSRNMKEVGQERWTMYDEERFRYCLLVPGFRACKRKLNPARPSYDSLWIITQRTRRKYVQARTKDVVRCPAYIARLCFHTYFNNLREASCLWSDSTCLAGNEANEESFCHYLSLLFSSHDDWKSARARAQIKMIKNTRNMYYYFKIMCINLIDEFSYPWSYIN